MEKSITKICETVVIVALLYCLYKCASIPSNDKKINGYYYDVIQLNDSTYLLNPTFHKRSGIEPVVVGKDSIGFYLNKM